MLTYQSLGIYNKIVFQQLGENQRLMSDESSEINRLSSLDPQIITAIHDQYYPDVYRFARFRVDDEVIAEDIAGDVFMCLLEAVHRGRGPTTNLRGWLLKTTANIVNDHYRNLYKHPVDDSSELHENARDLFVSQDDPAMITDESEMRQSIQAAMETLTQAQKLVITLRFGNRFSLEETAELMGKNINTIKALQFRALIALRQRIGSDLS